MILITNGIGKQKIFPDYNSLGKYIQLKVSGKLTNYRIEFSSLFPKKEKEEKWLKKILNTYENC